ncbi:MAG: RidA family protein [Patescibacteria group bacterium]|nr:RidA family protein [Patescibacteria group bacterium]
MIKTITTKKAPLPIGPYNQALISENFIFCSGQIGIDPQTGKLKEGLEEQTKQILENLKAVVEEAGSSLNKIIKTTIFLTSINDFPKVNEIYEKYFKNHFPARSTIEVKGLPKQALIEIEAIALK